MKPSLLQEPPRPLGASHMVCGDPPLAATLLSLRPARNPRYRLSGDQNGNDAPSVPGTGRASSDARGRTQSWVRPSSSVAVNARTRPSGETASAPRLVFSGAGAASFTMRGSGGDR